MYMTWLTVTHPPATPELGGLRVVLTRPRDDGLSLAQAIEHAGGNVLHLPSLVLEALSDPQPALDIVRRLNHFQLAVFVSKNAREAAQQRHIGVKAPAFMQTAPPIVPGIPT